MDNQNKATDLTVDFKEVAWMGAGVSVILGLMELANILLIH
ncbi:hypothetical protein [Falsibacillus albus]|nr:hypothetical protein [Falsibacillus albus]